MKQYNVKDIFQLTLHPMDISLSCNKGQTIMEVLVGADIIIPSDCGFQGTCGKCIVSVHPVANLSSPTNMEVRLLAEKEETPNKDKGIRLACQAEILGDVDVTLPTWDKSSDPVLPKAEASGSFAVAPAVKRIFIDSSRWLKPISWAENSTKDFYNFICREVESATGSPVSIDRIGVQRQLSAPVVQKGINTFVTHKIFGVTGVIHGERFRSTGLAVDIGTTSIATYLCDFQTGSILATASMLNPQQRFGEDVMSRIAFASRESEGLTQLNFQVVQGINTLLGICLEKAGIDKSDVDEMTVVGNPTMQQIYAGFHPHSLGKAPFTPFHRSAINIRAEDVGCNLNPDTNVYFFPVASGFIGGDILGCVLSDRTYLRDEITLIMDIGTNGELILGNRDGLWATSCATGPALEGAHISCGMRASTGAIHSVSISPDGIHLNCRVFGENKGHLAQGICGSGLIDAIAAMLQIGNIRSSGALSSDLPGKNSLNSGAGRRMVIVPASKSATNREIAITARDIRQVQLAKAALSTGIELLKQKSGFTKIERIVLTGAFGTKFNPESALIVGILPQDTTLECLEIIPNGAGLGAVRALLNRNRRLEIESIYSKIETLELAAEPDFSATFVEMMSFSPPSQKTKKGESKNGS